MFASALTGQSVSSASCARLCGLPRSAITAVSTGELNRVVMDAVRAHRRRTSGIGCRRSSAATVAGVAPPTFVIFVNDPELIHFSYRRYLENRIRAEYGFLGTPIRLILRQRESERPRVASVRAPGSALPARRTLRAG